ncbi:MAG TPA: DUF4183 domain-containing protein [Clostridiaceae bacterium]|nr:DUF4183 domain-containing protein [Clostridiaceae bacterium]
MAVELFKLKVIAETTTDTVTNPEVEKFFYKFDPAHRVDGTITIPANAFTDDAGDAVTAVATTVTDNGYYLLFINGVLQQSNLFTVSANGSQVVISQASTVIASSPITLVVNNFAPTSSSTTTVET